jgi:hypothetical protein
LKNTLILSIFDNTFFSLAATTDAQQKHTITSLNLELPNKQLQSNFDSCLRFNTAIIKGKG